MKDKRLTILIAGVVWIAQAFLISIPALGQNNWDPIDPNDAIAGIDVLLGPGYFYNPMDLHVRDGNTSIFNTRVNGLTQSLNMMAVIGKQ
jgi:hypothetical protein